MPDIVIYCSDSEFTAENTLVTAWSAASNGSCPLHFHLFSGQDILPEKIDHFTELLLRHGHKASYYSRGKILESVKIADQAPVDDALLFFLALPELLDCGKIIYCSNGIVFNKDPVELFSVDISADFFGAVYKPAALKNTKPQDVTFAEEFDASLLLVNLEQLRVELSNLRKTVADSSLNTLPEALSHLLRTSTRCHVLPELWNYRLNFMDRSSFPFSDYTAKVLNFSEQSPAKFWSNPALHYWHYYSQLFPQDDVFSKIMGLKADKYTYLYEFMMENDFVWRFVRRMRNFSQKGFLKTLFRAF